MEATDHRIITKIAKVAGVLPPTVLESVCGRLEELGREVISDVLGDVIADLAGSQVRAELSELANLTRMSDEPMLATELAWALRSASAVESVWRDSQSVELVWTGPSPEGSSFRRTDQALLDLIEHAEERLLLVVFAVFTVPSLVTALQNATKRGVGIEFIAESPETGKVSTDVIQALGSSLARSAKLYAWPEPNRERDSSGRFGTMHVKCAVADTSIAFVSSANITGHALNLNMELGVLIRGGAVPGRVRKHFDCLIAEGVLERIDATR